MLTATNLCKNFGELSVLKGISMTVHKGEVVALIGPSGNGTNERKSPITKRT